MSGWNLVGEEDCVEATIGVDGKEPPPEAGGQEVLPRVIADLKKRSDFGERKYGTKLKTFNGRRTIIDWYQESLDAVMYGAQAVMEEEGRMSARELQAENTRLVLENRELRKEIEKWKSCK
jgi:hypothetical protein